MVKYHVQCYRECVRVCVYVDVVLLVALVKVVHDGSLVELGQHGHVLHAIDAALVHGVHLLPVHLGLLQVQHLDTERERQRETTETQKTQNSCFSL